MVQLFVTSWAAADQASLSFIISQSLLNFMSAESVIPSNHLIFCHPLLLLSSIFPSIRVFSNESVRSPCCPRDFQASSPVTHLESINSLVLSFLYGPTLTSACKYWKNHTLTIQTFVDKVMSFCLIEL